MFTHFYLKKQAPWIGTPIFFIVLVSLGMFSLTLLRTPAFAQNTLDSPEVELVPVIDGLQRPVGFAHTGDGSGRIFIIEQRGQIFILHQEQTVTSFLDIRDRVKSPASGGGNEQGLLGMAFPPEYADKGYFYVYYTMHDGDNVVSRFYLSENPNIAASVTEEQVLVLSQPPFQNHNGGQLAFGLDGYLYIGVGDGGSSGDPFGNAQNPASLNGKLLRIDVEMENSPYKPSSTIRNIIWDFNCLNGTGVLPAPAYLIPKDNPFVNNISFRSEIWAYGLRNPWRFSFDRKNGDLYIADVGQDRWEEINYQPADSPGGENYGWNIMEAQECFGASSCNEKGLTLPAHVYSIFSSPNCSIIGGFVYRGVEISALEGVYVFGDFCSGKIWGMRKDGDKWLHSLLAEAGFMISAFGEDEKGEIYLADMVGGSIYKVIKK